jgi:ribonuclease HI
LLHTEFVYIYNLPNRETERITYNEESKSGATGVVLRDDRGQFIVAANQVLVQISDVESAEALALQHGFNLALQMECSRVVVNSDNQSVVEAMKKRGYSMSSAASILNSYAQQAT